MYPIVKPLIAGLICFLIYIHPCTAQETLLKFSREAIQVRLDSLRDPSDRIDFILDHFYKIYSEDFETAIHFTQYAVTLAQELGSKDQEAYGHLTNGVARYLRGDYEHALNALLRSSRLFDSLDHKKGIAAVNNELAVFYHKQQNDQAIQTALDKSEEAAKAAKDTLALSTNYHHRGSFLLRRGNYEEAKPYLDLVYKTRVAIRDSVGLGYILLDLAEYELHHHRLAEAITLISQSTDIRSKIGDKQGVAVNTVVIGETYFNSGDYKKSIPYFERGIANAREIKFTDLIRFTHDLLQECYVQTGDFKQAYKNLAEAKFLQDSLFNIEKTKAIAELQTKYETEVKDQQILLQTERIEKQEAEIAKSRIITIGLILLTLSVILIALLLVKRQKLKHEKWLAQEKAKLRETQIEAALNSQELERKRFARDLHDGFGQMISILNLNLKSLESGKVNREEVYASSTQVLSEMHKELKSICFNLMPETLIKSGVEHALYEFADRISQSGKIVVNMHAHGQKQRLTDLQEINLYRITQEWVNNVIKYAQADHITIQITRDGKELTLTIEDNGVGFNKAVLTEGRGNGWKNMTSRANLIKAELDIDTSPGRKGSTFILNAPLIPTPSNAKVEAVN